MKEIKSGRRGFTLIELLVVVLIIGILAAIALPQYKMVILRAKYARLKQNVSEIKRAYELYYFTNNKLPTQFSQLDFANKFDESTTIKTGDYQCSLSGGKYPEVWCSLKDNQNTYLSYNISMITKRHFCRTYVLDTSSIYHKFCQKETGKTLEQAQINAGVCYTYFY